MVLPFICYFKQFTFRISNRKKHTWARIGRREEKQASYFCSIPLHNLCLRINLIKSFGSLTGLDFCFVEEWYTFLARVKSFILQKIFFPHCFLILCALIRSSDSVGLSSRIAIVN